MALFSADDITYPPLDVLKPVADGIWIVAANGDGARPFVIACAA